MAEPDKTLASDADTRISPDPAAAVLAALAALGCIASIAAVNWVAQGKSPDRTKARRKAAFALKDLESCCLGLQEIFRRFQRHGRLFAGEGAAASAPLKLGVAVARISPETARQHQQLVNDIASMLVLASQNAFDTMSAIEDGEINAPEELFYGFGEQQERLNRLLLDRAPIRVAVATGGEVARRLTQLVQELKKHRLD